MQITNVPALKINKLTHEQFKRAIEAGRVNDNEMYLTPDNYEPYIVPMLDEDGALRFASGYEFSGKELFQAIEDKRPVFVHVWNGDSGSEASLYTFSNSDSDEGVAYFTQMYQSNDGHKTIIHKEIKINYGGRIWSYQTTHAIDSTLTKRGYAADAESVGLKFNNIEQICASKYEILPGTSTVPGGAQCAVANGNTVIVRGDSGIYTSLDGGLTWQETEGCHDGWSDLAYGNGKFVFVHQNDGIDYSEDGITWNHVNDVSLLAHSVAYGNGKFVAVGLGQQELVYWSSTDGINWEKGQNFPQSFAEVYERAKVLFLPFVSAFMIINSRGDFTTSDSELTSWIARSDAGFDSTSLSCVTNDQVIFATPFEDQSSNRNCIRLYFGDGINFEEDYWYYEGMEETLRAMYYNPNTNRVSILQNSIGYWFIPSDLSEPTEFNPIKLPSMQMNWWAATCYNDVAKKMIVFAGMTGIPGAHVFVTDGIDLDIMSLGHMNKIIPGKSLQGSGGMQYTYGEEDLIPGETPLESGKLHFVYI